MRIAPKVTVTEQDRRTLEQWARGRSTPVRLMQRAKIVLMAAEGQENKDIAVAVSVTRQLVGRWRSRYVAGGLPGIEKDASGRGRKPTVRDSLAARIIEMTTQSTPANATHWSTRTMAEALGTNRSMVQRVWNANGLKPHLQRTFKLSNDPNFIEKVVDVVGPFCSPITTGALLRREEPDSGPGPHPAGPAAEEGPLRNDDARLQTQRHDDAVRRSGVGRGQADRHVYAASSPSGVDQVPEAD